MTPSQYATLKASILADPSLADAVEAADDQEIADAYNAPASPDFWVWKTKLTRPDIESAASQDGTTWSYTAFIGRSQGERDCWREMMAEGSINPSLPNVRQGVADIFSGTAGAAQRTHLLAVSRRKASLFEKLLASGGDGSTSSPATMSVEGPLTYADVSKALRDN